MEIYSMTDLNFNLLNPIEQTHCLLIGKISNKIHLIDISIG